MLQSCPLILHHMWEWSQYIETSILDQNSLVDGGEAWAETLALVMEDRGGVDQMTQEVAHSI